MLKKLVVALFLVATLFVAPNVYAESPIEKTQALAEQGDAEAQFLLGSSNSDKVDLFKSSRVPADNSKVGHVLRALEYTLASTEPTSDNIEEREALVRNIELFGQMLEVGEGEFVESAILAERHQRNAEIALFQAEMLADIDPSSQEYRDRALAVSSFAAGIGTLAPEYEVSLIAAEKAQDLSVKDPVQRQVIDRTSEPDPQGRRSISDRIISVNARLATLAHLRDKLYADIFEPQVLPRVALEWTIAALIPAAKQGLVPTDRKGLQKLNFGATQYEQSMNLLYNMSDEEFSDFLPQLEENIRNNSRFIIDNRFLLDQIFESLTNSSIRMISYENTVAAIKILIIALFFVAALFVVLKVRTGSTIEEVRLAAEQGDAGAQSNLGLMYYNGRGVPQDFEEAYFWANLAAAQEKKNAKLRDIVYQELTPQQRARAQKRAREWQPKAADNE